LEFPAVGYSGRKSKLEVTILIEIGSKAPAFSAMTDAGEKVALKDFKGKKVVLYFYPRDLTPGCTTEACDFRDHHIQLKKRGVVVLGVSKDDVATHVKFREKHDLNFPLLADTDGVICEKYGVWQEKSLYGKKFKGIVRTTFVIDEEGRIAHVFPKVRVKEHVAKLLELL
jgi:peroxiredoxin Q/BCP